MSTKVRASLATFFLATLLFTIAMTARFLIWPVIRPISRAQSALEREFPETQPRLTILAGEKGRDMGMLQVEVTTRENPEENAAVAKAMAVRVAQIAKASYPMDGFSHIRVVMTQRGAPHQTLYTFSTRSAKSSHAVKSATVNLHARHAGTDIR